MFKKQKAQTTIQDLQIKINSIKQEIKEIRINSQIAHEQFRQEILALKLENNSIKQTPIISETEDKLQGDDDIEFLTKSNPTDLFNIYIYFTIDKDDYRYSNIYISNLQLIKMTVEEKLVTTQKKFKQCKPYENF